MNKKLLLYAMLVIVIVAISFGANIFMGKILVAASVVHAYQQTLPGQWKVPVKEMYMTPSIEGTVIEKNKFYKIQGKDQTFTVLNIQNQIITKGNAFSGDDYKNWESDSSDNVKVGDYILVNGYAHPAEKYIIPVTIFKKNR